MFPLVLNPNAPTPSLFVTPGQFAHYHGSPVMPHNRGRCIANLVGLLGLDLLSLGGVLDVEESASGHDGHEDDVACALGCQYHHGENTMVRGLGEEHTDNKLAHAGSYINKSAEDVSC
jgi:hypothetical protein